MSDKHFVGRDLTGFEDNGKTRPVSRVTLTIDEDNAVTAGDDTGYEIVASCPHATQAMADDILARMKGYQYQMYTAEAANIDPAAELGDGITADGVYGVISRLSDDGGGYPDVTGPGEAELEDEYPVGEGPMTREFNLKIARTRSLITKTAEEVRIDVKNDLDGLSSEFSVQLQSVTAQVNGLDDAYAALSLEVSSITATVKDLDGNYSLLEQTVSGFSATVDSLSDNMSHTLRLGADGMTVQDANGRKVIISNGNLNLSGAITFDDLQGSDAYDYTNDRWTYTGLKGMVDQAQYNAANAKDLANSAYGQVNQWAYVYNGHTYIDGGQLMTGTVTASKLQGGEVDLLASNGRSVGGIDIAWTDTDDYGLSFHTETDRGGIRLQAAGNVYLAARNEAGYIMIGNPDIRVNESITPASDGQLWLGNASFKWGAIYASSGTVQTSDRYLKHDIEPMPEKYTDMIDRIASVRYKYNDGTSNRYHTGFIAQEVKAVMDELGIDSTEFGGYVADVDGEGKPIYMLRYEEFIGILWNRVRELTNRINALEAHNG